MSSIAHRIKQARIRKGLSLRDLAERLDVSAMAISKYERGEMKPGSDVLLQLARALDVDVEFFLRPSKVGEIEPAYRKRGGLGKKAERMIIEDIRDWLERYLDAESISPVEHPAFSMPKGFPRRVASYDDRGEGGRVVTIGLGDRRGSNRESHGTARKQRYPGRRAGYAGGI